MVDGQANTLAAPWKLPQLVVYHRCDVTELTPEALAELNKELEPTGAFRDALEKLTADIPPRDWRSRGAAGAAIAEGR